MKNILVFLVVMILSSCKTAPKLSNYKLPKNSKVGIIFYVTEDPSHNFQGTTGFTNFNKKYKYTNLTQLLDKYIIKKLKEKDIQIIGLGNNISIDRFSMNSRFTPFYRLLEVNDGKWQVNIEHKELFNNLKNLDLDAVVVVNEVQLDTNAPITNFGLNTHSLLGYYSHVAVHKFNKTILLLEPLHRFSYNKRELKDKSYTDIEIKDIKDINNLTKNEWIQVDEAIELRIKELGNDILSDLGLAD